MGGLNKYRPILSVKPVLALPDYCFLRGQITAWYWSRLGGAVELTSLSRIRDILRQRQKRGQIDEDHGRYG